MVLGIKSLGKKNKDNKVFYLMNSIIPLSDRSTDMEIIT